jgi:mono/diheme cytochrome c family protein
MKRRVVMGVLCLLLLGLAGYGVWRVLKKPKPVDVGDLANYVEVSRDAISVPGPAGESAERVVYLDQGWDPRDSMEFYTRPQGSRLVPYSWFLALEQPGSSVAFCDPAHLARLGYLAQKANPFNPDGLPVGFVKDPRHDGEKVDWFGFTCAACHTAELHYNGTAYRIDGAPGQGDLDALLTALTAALKATLDDPATFERFAGKVLGADPTARNRSELRDQLETVYRARSTYDVANRPPHPYGFARLDAFGRIVNALLVSGVGVGDAAQAKAPDAPVSYPFLWDAPHHDYVQWNGSARNRLGGSPELAGLGRNVGQVIGVFGEVRISEPSTATALTGYKSSARVPDLIRLEGLVRKLQSPRWPDAFPPINEEKRKAGAELFGRYCQSCHAPIDRADPARTVTAVKTPIKVVGTDPLMAANFATRKGKTGRLEGRRAFFVAGERFGKEASAEAMLVHTVVAVILGSPWNQYGDVDFSELRDRKETVTTDPEALMVYKSRPLNGIWATAPYLHNGSVPSLYQLLLPAEARVKEFTVGRREFDPVNVGFRTDPFTGGFRFRTRDDAGRPIPGNSNTGHEYGTGRDGLPALTDEQRWQLVEYLKSL